ncbi:hypothetical protein ACFORH_31835 [Amycolatopsis roodepoortensis]|uniref:Uncharacterized protein n=1 Tax=Amycolatopsis roodepoortensis TaxID=700274 RepID=A0ABR9LBX1_9PSEU|nr:hypothetical protein [Amycolatopsis roodepoortensis]MBE1578025.1 hypothetical protein [Amycolatopsis roodepoortensis]
MAALTSIAAGVVGNLATDTVGEISAGWKPVIWTALGLLAAALTFSAIQNALRAARGPAPATDAPDAGPAERDRRARPWQAKAVATVWALIAIAGIAGAALAFTTPGFLDIGTLYLSSFQLERNLKGGWEVTGPAGVALGIAVFAWCIPPFLAGAHAYRAVPASVGETTRTLAACVAFVFAGWSVFAGTVACVAALRQLVSPGVAIYVALIGLLALIFTAWGWAKEAETLSRTAARSRKPGA